MAGQSRAQEAMEITLEDFIDNKEFDTNEIVITVIGQRATQCSWDDIQLGIERLDQPGQRRIVFLPSLYYRLEDPTC